MATPQERTPRERETLIFSTPEEAGEFRERVDRESSREVIRGVKRDHEVVADAVAHEFAAHSEGVGMLTKPWEHTPQEHEEAQRLVDTAFAEDLEVALRRARGSAHYPRNVDLLHDVLTNELYTLVREQGVNRAHVGWRWIVVGSVVALVLVVLVILLMTL